MKLGGFMGEKIKVDSHHHFWELGRLEYPWMPLGDPVLTRNYLPEDLAPILKQNQVSKTVLVQATHSLEEIINNQFWKNDLQDSWNNTTTSTVNPRLEMCANHCGEHIAVMNQAKMEVLLDNLKH